MYGEKQICIYVWPVAIGRTRSRLQYTGGALLKSKATDLR